MAETSQLSSRTGRTLRQLVPPPARYARRSGSARCRESARQSIRPPGWPGSASRHTFSPTNSSRWSSKQAGYTAALSEPPEPRERAHEHRDEDGLEAALRERHRLVVTALLAVLVLVLTGRFLEARARRGTGTALRFLAQVAVKEVSVREDGTERLVPIEQLRLGQVFVVRPGERVATDGAVVAGVFVPVVLALTVTALGFWFGAGTDPQAAITACVAVLVVACPCALGLARTEFSARAAAAGGERCQRLGRPWNVLVRVDGVTEALIEVADCCTPRKLPGGGPAVAPRCAARAGHRGPGGARPGHRGGSRYREVHARRTPEEKARAMGHHAPPSNRGSCAALSRRRCRHQTHCRSRDR